MKRIIKLFERGNVCVVGLRGCGKDMLMSNVVIRRKKPYISNIDYGGQFIPLTPDTMALGGNTFVNFKNGDIIPYEWQYPDGTDVYISDIGVYYPSQEQPYLDKHEKSLPLFMALSRQIGLSQVHTNCQNLLRCYTKIREQSDIYLKTNWCKVFFGKIVIQSVTLYEKEQSCADRVPRCPYSAPLFCPRSERELWNMKKLDYRVTYGDIKNYLLIYINKSSYDTRIFKKILKGEKNEE